MYSCFIPLIYHRWLKTLLVPTQTLKCHQIKWKSPGEVMALCDVTSLAIILHLSHKTTLHLTNRKRRSGKKGYIPKKDSWNTQDNWPNLPAKAPSWRWSFKFHSSPKLVQTSKVLYSAPVWTRTLSSGRWSDVVWRVHKALVVWGETSHVLLLLNV